jgi:hypothetical protein
MSVGPLISMVKDAHSTETHDVQADNIITAIRDGRWRESIEQIRREPDKETRNELKTGLPGMLLSGKFSGRKNEALIQHSGLLCADLDNLDGELQNVREKLLGSPYLWSAFVSPSGEGLKAVFCVPADVTKHKGSFLAVEEHVKQRTGIQIDAACKDPARLCFVSYDPQAFYNPDAQELTPLAEPEKPKPACNGELPPDLPLRERIATEKLGPLTWSAEKGGFFCECPGKAEHTNGTAEKHTILYLDGSPTLDCRHNSCQRIVEAFNAQLRSLIGKAERAEAQNRFISGQVEQQNEATGHTGTGNGKAEPALKQHRKYAFSDLCAIRAKAVEWIEEPYLARGEMHFLQGQGGSYKGTLALTWAAEFSRRGEHVLLILAEDDLAKKVKPLLMAAQADMALIHPLTIRCGDNEDALVLPDDLGQLEQAMRQTQAALVVIDPVVSHISGKLDSYRDQDMKRVLTRIGNLAQRMNASVVCVHHTKKDTSGGMKLAGAGSIALYTTARVVLTMAKLSEKEVVLEVVKSNLGPESARQLLEADNVEVLPGISVPKLTRVGESPVGVAEALNGERKEKETKTLTAAKLILDILEEEGEQKQAELFDRVAQETGLSPKTIRNKAYFGILVEEDVVRGRKDGFKGGWLVARSDKERPLRLRSVTPKSNPKGYTTETGYTSTFCEGNLLQQQGYSSCVSMANCNLVPQREGEGYTSGFSANFNEEEGEV